MNIRCVTTPLNFLPTKYALISTVVISLQNKLFSTRSRGPDRTRAPSPAPAPPGFLPLAGSRRPHGFFLPQLVIDRGSGETRLLTSRARPCAAGSRAALAGCISRLTSRRQPSGEAGLLISPSRRPGEALRRHLSRRPGDPLAPSRQGPAPPSTLLYTCAAPSICSLKTSTLAAVSEVPLPVPLARHCAAVNPPVDASICHPVPPRRTAAPDAVAPLLPSR